MSQQELDQIWANEPGSFLRVVRNDETGAVTLEWRTGPQGPTGASKVRGTLELTAYRAKRLGERLTAISPVVEVNAKPQGDE